MTIREVEEATGLTRANVRFYENQGLLATVRRENNYREYTQEHIAILLRIKLLRALGMTLEQIRDLQTGADDLIAALDRQIQELGRKQEQLGSSTRVCREMREDGVSYATLDAQRYLSSLENPLKKPSVIVTQDVEPRVFAPWQRFWARMVDDLVYTMILLAAATCLMNGRLPQWGSLVSTILGIAMTLALEPVQLRLFGTTIGKWIFGISVRDTKGQNLGFSAAFWRTAMVLWFGLAMNVPFLRLWRLFKSYKMYESNEFLPWDDNVELTVKDKKPIRFLSAIVAAVLVFGLGVGCMILAQLPENRGELTIAQFCENYRKFAAQTGADSERFILRDDGTWQQQDAYNTVYVDLAANSRPLAFSYTTEDGTGALKSVSITETVTGPQKGMVSGHINQMQLMALAFLTAQPEYNVFASDETEIQTAITDHPFESFCVSICGLEFRYEVAYTGYFSAMDSYLFEDDDPKTEPWYSMTFAITKAE